MEFNFLDTDHYYFLNMYLNCSHNTVFGVYVEGLAAGAAGLDPMKSGWGC